jgi:hypothetical protein
MFGDWKDRVRDLETKVRELERRETARELELAEYLDRFTRLFKRVDQRARYVEEKAQRETTEQLEVDIPQEESVMSMRARFGR